jgi:hypothetical protein
MSRSYWGGALGAFGLALILGAVARGPRLGPPELIVGLITIGVGAVLVLSTRREGSASTHLGRLEGAPLLRSRKDLSVRPSEQLLQRLPKFLGLSPLLSIEVRSQAPRGLRQGFERAP